MSETNGPSPQVLRALGQDEAADALQAADALIPKSEPDAHQDEPADMQRRHEPQHQVTAWQLAEEQRQREARVMLDAAKAAGIYDDR